MLARALNVKEHTAAVFLEFTRACNMVCHPLLLFSPRTHGAGGLSNLSTDGGEGDNRPPGDLENEAS